METYDYMMENNTTGVPIVDEDKKFISLVTAKDILNKSIFSNDVSLITSSWKYA